MRLTVAVIAVLMMLLPGTLSAGTDTFLAEGSTAEIALTGPTSVATLASMTQRADCNMTCDGDCCTETCCGPDGCETCKTCCPGGDCSKYCYEHKKGKKGDGKSPASKK